ncbi:MAG TPA: anthranilate synthase component I [Acidimicrobiia bacterium]|nr:anthranilate synthase component I [Acidimicrobiia bacterium]
MPVVPDRSTFLDLAAGHGVVPVSMQVLADRETAVTAYEKLVGDDPGFLLESVEGGENWARWSFVGWNAEYTLTARDGVSSLDDPEVELPDGNPLEVLEGLISRLTAAHYEGLPPLHTGAVGWLGYDAVRYVEHLPNRPPDDRRLPEMMWQFVGSLAAFDRLAQRITLVRNVFVGDDPAGQYDRAVADLEDAAARLGRPFLYEPRSAGWEAAVPAAGSTLERDQFERAVHRAKEYIFSGDAFQIVISQRLEVPFTGDTFSVYRALRMINPSPFLFYHKHPEVTVIGSSPELMTRVRDGVVYSRPIAGTRPRGDTQAEDERLAEELLADPKERAEHVMLIDLARNDVGRVCEYGTVQVDDLMVIERYSHVMHIVSGVSGRLRPGIGPVDVLRATFPHGTVSGAPKVRAMEIIDELEPVTRGPYAGAVGYIDFSGNIDTAICLRTVVAADGKAWVQAGAGLVADSDPAAEYDETMNKAAAALAAIAGAAHV